MHNFSVFITSCYYYNLIGDPSHKQGTAANDDELDTSEQTQIRSLPLTSSSDDQKSH